MNTVAIIQARMGSTRLPGKVLMDVAGEPMLARVVTRTARAEMLDAVAVATSAEPSDDPIATLCDERGWPCFRGSADDVLDRYYRAAEAHGADLVVRITSDCPLIDPGLIDRVVREFHEQAPVDFARNTFPPETFPWGLDVEVMTFAALERAWREAENPAWREDVTVYLYRHPETFRLHAVVNDEDLSWMRWTVDTAEDLALVRTIYGHFGHDRFRWRDVLAAFGEHPEWAEINRGVKHKRPE